MVAIKLSAYIGEDRKLIIDLPEDAPIGEVDLIIQQAVTNLTFSNPEREAARAKLRQHGLLSTAYHLPTGTRIPTDAEVLAAGQLPFGAKPSESLMNEDRKESKLT